jgi:hypothetical protein
MSPEELRLMVESWEEVCRDIPDAGFVAACKVHLREGRFFPCPADIVKAYEDSVPRYQPFEIPAVTSSEEEEHRADVSAKMCALGLENPEVSEFFRFSDWKVRLAFARRVLGRKYPGRKKAPSRGPVSAAIILGAGTGAKQ